MAVRVATERASPIFVGDTTFVGLSQAVMIDLQFARFLWNRPIGVLVERAGRTRRVPVVDVTRLLQVAFYALTLGFLVARLLTHRR